MKKRMFLFLIFMLSVIGFAEENFIKYQNSRFNFEIDTPKNFLVSEADNGDGITITNNKEDIKFLAYGSNAILIEEDLEDPSLESLKKLYNNKLKEYGEKISYKVFKNNFFVISYTEDNKMVYEKVLYNKISDSICYYYASYPLNMKEQVKDIVAKMSNSFKEN